MSTLTQVERPSQAGHAEESLSSLRREQRIRADVLASLGLPAHLLKVAVLPLWDNKFRVIAFDGAGSESVELSVVLDLSWLVKSSAGVGLRLGLAAVIEDKARVLSYWALKHPAEKPDFHHAESFVVELD